MGIRPWISKSSGDLVNDRNSRLRLLVLTPELISDAERLLLKQMFFYLNLPEEELLVTNRADPVLANANVNKLIIWCLGSEVDCTPDQILIRSMPLAELLARPKAKKNIFSDLSRIKKELVG
jgi:hypothetical protein